MLRGLISKVVILSRWLLSRIGIFYVGNHVCDVLDVISVGIVKSFKEVKIDKVMVIFLEVLQLAKSVKQLFSLFHDILNIGKPFLRLFSKNVLIIRHYPLIILFHQFLNLLANPLKFLNTDTKPMHFLQHFGQLFVLVQEHLIDLFLEQFLFNYWGFVSLWVAD